MTSKEMKERLSKKPNPHNLYAFNEKQVKELIKDLEILETLEFFIEIIPNNATDTKSLLNIRIKPCHIIDDEILLRIKEWLDE